MKRSMSASAWIYLFSVFSVATVLIVRAFGDQSIGLQQWLCFAILVGLATLFQFFEYHDGRQSYYPHTVFFVAGMILLPPGLFVLLVALPHLVEWIYKRLQKSRLLQDWYIQPFNISTHVVAGLVAQMIYHATLQDPVLPFSLSRDVEEMLIAYWAIIIYIFANHALIGQALVLARGISWRESGVMEVEKLLVEMVMASLGYISAVLWLDSPWLLLPFFLSLLLLGQALMVPQLKKEVKIDAKTGLLNAKHFQDQFGVELQRAQRFQHPLSLILADLDLLRDINNVYGHLGGDVVIQGVAQLIQEQIRTYDVAGRFGGEEFAIVLPETNVQEAQIIAERIRKAVETTPFIESATARSIRATMSLGVATFPSDGNTVEGLIAEADIALYQAKYQGRNATTTAADIPHSQRLQYASFASLGTAAEARPDRHDHELSGSQPAEEDRQPVEVAASTAVAQTEPDLAAANSAPPVPPAPLVPPAPSALLWPYIGMVILMAGSVAAWGLFQIPGSGWLGIVIFLLLAALAEGNQLDLFENNTVSVSVAASFAAAVIGGIPGAVLVSGTIALIHYGKMRPVWYKFLFNWATHLLAALPAVLLVRLWDIPLVVSSLPILTLLAVPAALLVFLLDTGLIAIAMGLAMRTNIIQLWQERFQWLGASYLALGILGLFLAIGYAQIGPWSIVLFILPILVMYATQKMYVQRTQTSVRELRRMNQELVQANTEVAKANDEIQRLNDQLFLILAKVIDTRDPDVTGHATRVAEYAIAVAAELELPANQQEYIRQAALLHDIGKLGIPERILYKEEKLSHEEYQIVKRHAHMGAELLEASDVLRNLAPAIRHHHERWDGKGYPSGLRQEQIPLAARILALCDAVEVMASGRHYEPAKPFDAILREIRCNKGTQFDPQVVESFIKVTQGGQRMGTNVLPVVEAQAKTTLVFPSPVFFGRVAPSA